MAETSIEWTDHSINPIRFGKGHFCQKISPGCANCYASGLQHRFGNPPFAGTTSRIPMQIHGTGGGGLWLDESKLQEVLNRKKPTKYFWCDMTDMFGDWVPDEWIDTCVATMAFTPHHTHQVLTKRTDRMRKYFSEYTGISLKALGRIAKLDPKRNSNSFEFPLKNVWLGTSVENQATADERIPLLLQTPAAVRFLSCEPLLGPVDIDSFLEPHNDGYANGIEDRIRRRASWVIVGGESGHGARLCNVAWIRFIVKQCKAASVPVFVKQMGGNLVGGTCASCDGNESPVMTDGQGRKVAVDCIRCDGSGVEKIGLSDRKGGNPAEWPEDLRVREFPRTDK